MTTNAGSSGKSGSVGFGGTLSDMSKERALKALGEFLRPEFMNRVDEIICFNQLSEENFASIAELMLGELRDAVRERNIRVVWNDDVVKYLVKEGYSVTYGARNLRRLIQKKIEDPAAEKMIAYSSQNYGESAAFVSISVGSDGEPVITVSGEKEENPKEKQNEQTERI